MKWFKHDSDANMDAKLQEILLDYGLEGYGLYWYCIELITQKINGDNITFELEHDARIIARNTGSSQQKVQEIMRKFIDLGLFENSDGVVTCLKLARRLDKSMTNSPRMRDLIDKVKKEDRSNLECHDDVSECHDDVSTSHARIDKIRIDKKRKEKKESKQENTALILKKG